ncbi:MAG: hypothetical protein OEZ00_08485 [Dehalococcoidia bacterium]|nr:hypothetical protein [Dehalococcoidia bacterium]
MGKVKDVASNLMQMLKARQKEAKSLVDTMHELQSYLNGESKSIIQGGLDRLLTRIRAEAAKISGGEITRWSVVVLVSPEGMVTVRETYYVNPDSWLERLKSQGFSILSLEKFRSFIQSLKSEVAEGDLMPAIEFLRANAKFRSPPAYSPAPAIRESERSEPSTPSRWKPSDFLPALPHRSRPCPEGCLRIKLDSRAFLISA